MAFRATSILLLAQQCLASVSLEEPSDYVNVSVDAADNAILADWHHDASTLYQLADISGNYYYSGTNASRTISYIFLAEYENDTSVLVVTEESNVNLSYVEVLKEGYGSRLDQESFFGVNAAINVANGSIAYIDHANITTHNGAANLFAYGDDTVVYISDTDLYSSGPTAHGLYAAGNATIYGTNIRHFSGGNRCSSFCGDMPYGEVHINDSIAHTTGIGSPTFGFIGHMYGTNVVGLNEQSPAIITDGAQNFTLDHVDLTAGLLAGTVFCSSTDRRSGAGLNLTNSRLTTLYDDMPAMWFGNVIATAWIISTEFNFTSGVLVMANVSQVNQDFDYFAGGEQNSQLAPAIVDVHIVESAVTGDLVAYNESSISLYVGEHANWTGTAYSAYGDSFFGVFFGNGDEFLDPDQRHYAG